MASKNNPTSALATHIEHIVEDYLKNIDHNTTDIYQKFLSDLEEPLLIATLKHTRGNQSKTARLLGLNRGTLRTKLKAYGLL